jgi:predicted MPP superfamily phosphohydrolase
MARSIILRYSDAEEPTIPAHQRVIAQHQGVWWGWWKKRTEPFWPELLRDLKESAVSEPIHVGLVNRKGVEEYSDASCVAVAFDVNGVPIPSPDATLTPDYYKTMPFPAWFKFTHFESLPRQEFVKRFGAVPSLDPTLYEVVWEDDRARLIPESSWTMEPVDTIGDTILHLSDLHFGQDHGFPLERPQPGQGVEGRPLHEIIANRVSRELGCRIGVVVVSGDLVTRGDANGYPHAFRFLERLLSALGLEKKHCVIVPGNHDLWTLDIEHPTRQYAHEGPYRLFVNGFFQVDFQGLERVRRFRTKRGLELIFVELNSARIRSDTLREYGYVAKHRYSELLAFVKRVLNQETPRPEALLFAVLHHHVLPVATVSIPEEKRPVSMCLDAGELIEEFQSNGIRFVLHGHQHAPFIGMTARIHGSSSDDVAWAYEQHPLFVLGCGSSGAKRERLPEDLGRNCYGIYAPTKTGFRVIVEQYTPTMPPTPLWRVMLPINA